jgi:hypothetical protein
MLAIFDNIMYCLVFITNCTNHTLPRYLNDSQVINERAALERNIMFHNAPLT